MTKLSKVLLDARLAKKLTADQVGRLIGRDRQTVYRYERGVTMPNAETLKSYVQAGLITAEEALGINDAA